MKTSVTLCISMFISHCLCHIQLSFADCQSSRLILAVLSESFTNLGFSCKMKINTGQYHIPANCMGVLDFHGSSQIPRLSSKALNCDA